MLGLVLAVAGFPRAGAAGTIYMYKDPRGVMHFTDLPRSEDYTPYCTWPDSNQVDRGRILSLIRTYSRQYGIDPGLVQAVVRVESNFSPTARSKAGAEGLMQLMPQTQQDMGVNRPMDIEDNIQGGVRYLHHLLDRFSSLELALAAYNAGPARVEAHGGVPPFPETQRYVRKVLSVYQDYSAKTREYVQSGQ
ncbi:transglycosylase SLT domain-containing protein [Desulfovermiculus halophilus]|uniref:transglycosylase SLT domain-containing protein n=1 Tax=Desulfovermiculus halophilus TaxID=339722 RepID=UPI003CC51E2F